MKIEFEETFRDEDFKDLSHHLFKYTVYCVYTNLNRMYHYLSKTVLDIQNNAASRLNLHLVSS